MKVTGVSALALPLFASLSSAFLVVDTIHHHHSQPSVWNYNEQKVRLVCAGCPWDGEGRLSDLIFTVKANKNKLSVNDVTVNRRTEDISSVLVTQVRHGARPTEQDIAVPVEFTSDLHGIATAVDKPESVENAVITIKSVGGKVVDLQPIEIMHHVDGVRENTISILRASPARRIACNTVTCKAKQTASHGIKAIGFRITLIKGKIVDGAKSLKAGCSGAGSRQHGRPHPEMMRHGRPHGHHGGAAPIRQSHGLVRSHGILATVAIVLYPIFFGIAAGIFTSLLCVLTYKTIFAVVSLFKGRKAESLETVNEDVEAHGLLDEKIAYDDEPPVYQDDATFVVVVPAEKE